MNLITCWRRNKPGTAMKGLFAVLLGVVVALGVAAPAAADPQTAIPFEDKFPDLNPCTGDIMTVTVVGTDYVHHHDGRLVVHSERTFTTSDGSVGHGTSFLVGNDQVITFSSTDIMTNTSGGYHFRARAVFVLDLSTETVRVERFELTCLEPA